MYGRLENVEWDERKSAENVLLRGFGFDFAAQLFFEDYVARENQGRDFGEPRFVAIGAIGALIVTVIWTPR
ncbi:MAG: BrnT family toxin [Candidatus Eremiobacteraeota bacterium]|nr:BrnT family toxin [Candidatus Eremiobacteraeota bacterium]